MALWVMRLLSGPVLSSPPWHYLHTQWEWLRASWRLVLLAFSLGPTWQGRPRLLRCRALAAGSPAPPRLSPLSFCLPETPRFHCATPGPLGRCRRTLRISALLLNFPRQPSPCLPSPLIGWTGYLVWLLLCVAVLPTVLLLSPRCRHWGGCLAWGGACYMVPLSVTSSPESLRRRCVWASFGRPSLLCGSGLLSPARPNCPQGLLPDLFHFSLPD